MIKLSNYSDHSEKTAILFNDSPHNLSYKIFLNHSIKGLYEGQEYYKMSDFVQTQWFLDESFISMQAKKKNISLNIQVLEL